MASHDPDVEVPPSELGAPEVAKGRAGLGLILWLVTLAGTGYYAYLIRPVDWIRSGGGFLGQPRAQTLLGLVIEHWILIALLVVVILIIAGQIGSKLGIPALFRDEPRPGNRWYRAAAFWGGVGATLLVAQVWTAIYYAEMTTGLDQFQPQQFRAGSPFRYQRDLLVFLRCCGPPFLLYLALAAALPAPGPGLERRGRELGVELARFVAGMVVAIATVIGTASLGSSLHRVVLPAAGIPFEMPRLFAALEAYLKIQEAFPARDLASKEAVTSSFVMFTLSVFGFYAALTGFFRRSLSPGMGICIVLSLGVLLYSVMVLLNSTGQMILAVALAGWIVFANMDPYKYRFPGMASYNRKSARVDLRAPAPPPASGPFAPVASVEALDHWRQRTGTEKPKLVLVAVTGGAYRAAFWTTVVLDELTRVLPDFSQRVRLITGASGGMVGAGYYTSLIERNGLSRPATEVLRNESRGDSLTPIVRRLVRRDLPLSLVPFPQDYDRGSVLEEQWATLDRTFGELREGEEEGWRPSMVLSPMVVESGRRLLIGNLDLSNVVAILSARSRDYGRPAAEFFRYFPGAYPTFRLRTAVRMSATFPYASPAVSLPTVPPRRVVDAGYYDNFGVDVASVWAYVHRDWVLANTSGLALIEIRAHPDEHNRLAQLVLRHELASDPASRFVARLRTGVQGLTSPLEGGLNARDWAMQFHNANAVRILDDLFNGQLSRPVARDGDRGESPPPFFESFVFENFADFAMNWFISERDIRRMERSIGARPPAEPDPALLAANTGARGPAVTALQRHTDRQNLKAKERLAAWWAA